MMRDTVAPNGHWQFDADVTAVFEDMLARSIPQYDVMRRAVFELGSAYVQPNTWIIDIGCSRGEALAPFVDQFGDSNEYLGIEISEPMAMAARGRFAGDLRVVIRQDDLRQRRPPERASLTLSVLTLQFTPIEYRQAILRDLYNGLLPGGAFILVEKVLGAGAELNAQMVDRYYALKGSNGYSPEAIERKRLSLEGVLVPVTARWNEELLREAGFEQIDCFWRWMNFAGWIAVKHGRTP
jgi:tRNA (cmo5U34)-methyltransferase